MGKRGPSRTPTAQLKLVGSRLLRYRTNEPEPAKKRPSSSIKLSSAERRIYNKTVDLIESMGLIAETDGNAIARYAKAVVKYNEVCEFIAKHGDSHAVYDMKNGQRLLKYMRRFPESSMRNELETTLLRLERDFGLTPSGRASLEVEKSQDKFANEFIA